MPAFGGLLSPHWQPKARAVLVGMSAYSNRKHIVRAVLEASAYQTREILDAMIADSGVELTELKVDGGSLITLIFILMITLIFTLMITLIT